METLIVLIRLILGLPVDAVIPINRNGIIDIGINNKGEYIRLRIHFENLVVK